MNERLNEIKQTVRASIRRNTHSGLIKCGDCNAICYDMQACLDDVYWDGRLSDPIFTLDAALFILITGAKLASTADSSSGYLTDVIDHTLALLDDAIKAIISTQDAKAQAKCCSQLIKDSGNPVFDGWDEWSYELLEHAITLATAKELPLLEQVMALRPQKPNYDRYDQSRQLVLRAKIKRKFEGGDAATRFMYEHLDDDHVCEAAVRIAIEESDYQEAERLCFKKLASEPFEYYYRPAVWRVLLFDIYSHSGDEEKLLKASENLFFLGDQRGMDTIISIHQKRGDWEEARLRFIQDCENRLPSAPYMAVLKQFGEWQKLMTVVERDVKESTAYNMSAIFDYAVNLIAVYPKKTIKAYVEQVRRTASAAANRNQYRAVCRRIATLYKLGGKVKFADNVDKNEAIDLCKQEASALVQELKQTYQSKPAFLDELGRAL